MSDDIRQHAEALADLMDEFQLSEARLEGEDWKVAFRRKPKQTSAPVSLATARAELAPDESEEVLELAEATPPAPKGVPVTSPMTGIFYAAPSPSAPPFVKEGDSVTAGSVIGLIEAMKVFNEIIAPQSGTVLRVIAKSGDVVNPGEPLLYIG